MMRRLLLLACLALAAPALAQPAPGPAPSAAAAAGVTIAGTAGPAHWVDLHALAAMPATELTVSFATEHGTVRARFSGPLLWNVLGGPAALGTDPRQRLRRTMSVTGRDGYVAALALAEIDPALEGKQVLLATRRDGKALDRARLVVPGDRHGGRSVRDVVRIDVR